MMTLGVGSGAAAPAPAATAAMCKHELYGPKISGGRPKAQGQARAGHRVRVRGRQEPRMALPPDQYQLHCTGFMMWRSLTCNTDRNKYIELV